MIYCRESGINFLSVKNLKDLLCRSPDREKSFLSAGEAVDAVIQELTPPKPATLLLIAHRITATLAPLDRTQIGKYPLRRLWHLGGEEGPTARLPAADRKSRNHVKPIWEKLLPGIQTNHTTYVGDNGASLCEDDTQRIEYGVMQLITEAYEVSKHSQTLTA